MNMYVPVVQRSTPRLERPKGRSPYYKIVWAERLKGNDKWTTRTRSTGEADRDAAERVFNDFMQGFVQHRPLEGRPRFAELAAVYLLEHCAPRSSNLLASQRNGLRAPTLAFGQREPIEITAKIWGQYVKDRRAGKYSGQRKGKVCDATIRREMGAASAALNWCVKHGKLDRASVHPMALPEPGEPSDTWLDEAELDTVLAAADKTAPPDVRLAVYLFAFTGARREAVVKLTAGQVGPRQIDFRVPGQRHGRKRRAIVPISKRLRPVLDPALAGLAPEDRVVTTQHMRTWDRRFREWADSEGFTDLTPHVFRHSFITHRFRAGVDPWKIAGVVNEDLKTLLRVYGHHQPDHLADAIDF